MKKLTVLLLSVMAALFTAQLSAQELTIAEVENSIKADSFGKNSCRPYQGQSRPALPDSGVWPPCKRCSKGCRNTRAYGQVEKEGVAVLACGISMKKFNIATADLPRSVQVTKNGLLYIFGLQENGYKTITL